MKGGVTFFDTTVNQSMKILQLLNVTVSVEVQLANILIEEIRVKQEDGQF